MNSFLFPSFRDLDAASLVFKALPSCSPELPGGLEIPFPDRRAQVTLSLTKHRLKSFSH